MTLKGNCSTQINNSVYCHFQQKGVDFNPTCVCWLLNCMSKSKNKTQAQAEYSILQNAVKAGYNPNSVNLLMLTKPFYLLINDSKEYELSMEAVVWSTGTIDNLSSVWTHCLFSHTLLVGSFFQILSSEQVHVFSIMFQSPSTWETSHAAALFVSLTGSNVKNINVDTCLPSLYNMFYTKAKGFFPHKWECNICG